ncbi:MAG: DUF2089 domain-containing protein [Anaerolineaceae bacterium]|nr:DUF2089 domain-containing protein [Anaerolineaceae bacterium]
MYEQPEKCPVCKAELIVTGLACTHCDTRIEGHFQSRSNPFTKLNGDQQQFLLSFVQCEGKFNRLEEELSLSYPTLRNRFNEIVQILGFQPSKEDRSGRPSEEERRKILEELEQGLITPQAAREKLMGKSK